MPISSTKTRITVANNYKPKVAPASVVNKPKPVSRLPATKPTAKPVAKSVAKSVAKPANGNYWTENGQKVPANSLTHEKRYVTGKSLSTEKRVTVKKNEVLEKTPVADKRSSLSMKNDTYTQALKRSLLESQLEREYTDMQIHSQVDIQSKLDVRERAPYTTYSTGLSTGPLTVTTNMSMSTTSEKLEEMGEEFPEMRIETAADKPKVFLTDDIEVSLTLRAEDNKLGMCASKRNIEKIRCDIFESRLAAKCTWFDISGNMLKFDRFAKKEGVPDTVKSRKISPSNVPDLWEPFTNLQELVFGRASSEKSVCKRGNLLRNIPSSIFTLSNLKILSFSSNQLQFIPPEISNLVNLELLYLDDNELMDFQMSLLDLPRLKLLDIDHNTIEHVHITKLPKSLRYIRLKSNNISSFRLDPCANILSQLDLSRNNLSAINNIDFKSLNKLKILDFSSNVIESLPKDIGKLENLRRLYLDDNMLEEMSPTVCLLKKLTLLNMSRNSIPSIPPDIGNLTYIRELYLEDNQLDNLPDEIKELKRLLTLCLSGNKFKKIPIIIKELVNLRDLLLFSNKIRNLDMVTLSLCTNLVVLGLSANRIKNIPPEINQFKNIRIIQLDSNRLTNVPDEIGDLSTVRYLSLNDNRIEFIPEAVSQLTKLVGLMMDTNLLTNIPDSIGNLKNLRILSIKDNYIEYIPESISLLVNIELFDLCNNRLTRLPSTISELNERVDLKICNNQLELPPQEVADKGIISIKTYLDTHQMGVSDAESENSEFHATAL